MPVGSYIVLRGKSLNNTFGFVRKDNNGNPKPHQGWDIAAFVGSPIYAIADGTIEFIGNQGDYGKQVCLKFENKGQTLYGFYAHLNTIEVAKGQAVKEGQRLGTTGQTGNAAGQYHAEAHLHFELRTKPNPGAGLTDRLDPMLIFGISPVLETIF